MFKISKKQNIMKIKHLLFRFIFFFCSFTIFSQTIPSLSQANITPNGIFDTIIGISKTGPIQKFHLSDLDINKKTIDGIGNSILSASVLCSTGYFEIYGESGCGFEPVSNPTLNILHTQRLNVLCHVFTDLSGFIINKGGNANKVRYIIKNQSVIASAATSMQLGQNTQFLILPQTSIGPIGGIMDYATWLTINTGQDAYYNLISPYNSNYYHAMLAFNFSNPGIFWNTNLIGPPASGEIDLYTTILHEVAHSL